MPEKDILVPDDKGNFVRVQRQDTEKAESSLEKTRGDDFFIRVGACTQSLDAFLKAYAVDYGLTLEETLASVYLLNLNNREFAPENTENWKEYFDDVCKYTWNWFVKNKE